MGSTFSAGHRRPLVLTFLGLEDVRLLQLGRRLLAALTAGGREPRAAHPDAARGRRGPDPLRLGALPAGARAVPGQPQALLRALPEVPGCRSTSVPWCRTSGTRSRSSAPTARAWTSTPGSEHFDAAAAGLHGRRSGDRARGAGRGRGDRRPGRRRALRPRPGARGLGALRRGPGGLPRRQGPRRAPLPRAGGDQPGSSARWRRRRAPGWSRCRRRSTGAAPHGIVGDDLMLEHLHPNLEGYFVMADAFYRSLHEHGAIGPWEHPVSVEQARREMPVTEVDRLYGEYRIAGLTAGWPFSDGEGRFRPPPATNPVERIAQNFYRGSYPWPDAMRELLDYYRSQGATAEAAKVAALLADAFPYRPEDQRPAAAPPADRPPRLPGLPAPPPGPPGGRRPPAGRGHRAGLSASWPLTAGTDPGWDRSGTGRRRGVAVVDPEAVSAGPGAGDRAASRVRTACEGVARGATAVAVRGGRVVDRVVVQDVPGFTRVVRRDGAEGAPPLGEIAVALGVRGVPDVLDPLAQAVAGTGARPLAGRSKKSPIDAATFPSTRSPNRRCHRRASRGSSSPHRAS